MEYSKQCSMHPDESLQFCCRKCEHKNCVTCIYPTADLVQSRWGLKTQTDKSQSQEEHNPLFARDSEKLSGALGISQWDVVQPIVIDGQSHKRKPWNRRKPSVRRSNMGQKRPDHPPDKPKQQLTEKQRSRKIDGVSGTVNINSLAKEVRHRLVSITGCSDIPKFIRRASDYSTDVKSIIQSVCAYVQSSVPGLESFWLGCRLSAASGETEYVLVAQVVDKDVQFPTMFSSLQVIKRYGSQISKEAEVIAAMERKDKLQFSDKENLRIRECLTKNTRKLMKEHSNLLIISVSHVKSKRFGCVSSTREKQTCIALYVYLKGVIPFGEDHFPTNLDGIPVDVREGTFTTFSKNPDDFHQHLIMGCTIVTAYNTSGTLGGFVQLDNGKEGCLTCCHLFETPESYEDYNKGLSHVKCEVFQPLSQTDCMFGKAIRFENYAGNSTDIGVDAALIEITDPKRIPIAGEFPDATSPVTGFSKEEPMEFTSGEIVHDFEEINYPCAVVKYGAQTGHTIGMLRSCGPAVHKRSPSFNPFDRIQLHQQIEISAIQEENKIKPFASEGDSGSLVFVVSRSGNKTNIRALGLLVGGTTYGSGIVTPIWAVLKKLGLPQQLMSFHDRGTERKSVNDDNERLRKIESDVTAQNVNITSIEVNLRESIDSTEHRFGLIENKIDNIQTTMKEQTNHMDSQFERILNAMPPNNP